jgi:hypothetical protein
MGNTTVRFDTRNGEETMLVRYHYTDILRFYANGDVEVVAVYNSFSTNVRYREFGFNVWSDKGSLLCSIGGLTFPFHGGIRLSSDTSTLSGSEALRLLSMGCRIGDKDACDAMTQTLTERGLFGLARAILSQKGARYGREFFKCKAEYESLDEAISDRWFADCETLDLVRCVTKRDVLVHDVDASAKEATISGKRYMIVSGLTHE